jgi:hypothetical protein
MRKAMVVLAVFGLIGTLWAADPFVGTWKLSVAKSKVSNPGTMPKSEILKVEAALGNSTKWTYEGVDASGKPYTMVCSAKYDGKDYPMTGMPSIDTWALKRIDATTCEHVGKKAEKEVARGRIISSKDGKTLTMTVKETNPKGQGFTATWVWDKQ